MLDELLTTRQVADLLQLPVSTVSDYARRGLLPSFKLGRHRRFMLSRVETAILALATTSTPGPARRVALAASSAVGHLESDRPRHDDPDPAVRSV